jgi:hypothetical protein
VAIDSVGSRDSPGRSGGRVSHSAATVYILVSECRLNERPFRSIVHRGAAPRCYPMLRPKGVAERRWSCRFEIDHSGRRCEEQSCSNSRLVFLMRQSFMGAVHLTKHRRSDGWAFISAFRSSCLTSERAEAPFDELARPGGQLRHETSCTPCLSGAEWSCAVLIGPPNSPTDRAEIGRISRPSGSWTQRWASADSFGGYWSDKEFESTPGSQSNGDNLGETSGMVVIKSIR